jgi:hypothetical protein
VPITADEIFGTSEHAKRDSPVKAVEEFIRRFCVLPDEAYLPLALWALATYTPNSFECFPYVALLSPAKRCGKTRALEVLELVSNGAWRGTSPSAAALYRMMESTPTLLLDEVEALNRKGASEVQQAILSILNTGHRKGATVPRCEGPKNEVRHFAVYGPKAFAAIGGLPDTLLDRSIVVTMQRKTTDQPVERLLQSRATADVETTRAASESFMQDHAEEVRIAYEYLMAGDLKFLSDRDADHVETSTLLALLLKMEESPWMAEITLTDRKVARMLKPFEVKPGQFRQGDRGGLRGYSHAALEAAWRRYL